MAHEMYMTSSTKTKARGFHWKAFHNSRRDCRSLRLDEGKMLLYQYFFLSTREKNDISS